MVLNRILKSLPLNLMALCLLVWLLYPVDRLTEANLEQLKVGMPVMEAISIIGIPITEQGYRVGVLRMNCFGAPVDFESDEEGFNGPGGNYRIGYAMVPTSSWSASYIIREVPQNRPSAVKNPDLKVWVGSERCVWAWNDSAGRVTHLVVLPVELSGGWRDKYLRVKIGYRLDGWKGVFDALKQVLAV